MPYGIWHRRRIRGRFISRPMELLRPTRRRTRSLRLLRARTGPLPTPTSLNRLIPGKPLAS
jgi:hypothetical protein